jgi:hypothetical protein
MTDESTARRWGEMCTFAWKVSSPAGWCCGEDKGDGLESLVLEYYKPK